MRTGALTRTWLETWLGGEVWVEGERPCPRAHPRVGFPGPGLPDDELDRMLGETARLIDAMDEEHERSRLHAWCRLAQLLSEACAGGA